MADETIVQSDYTTVQLHRDFAWRIKVLAAQRKTSVKVEMDNAAALYLQQATSGTSEQPQAQPVQA
jgi:hypothetical protein